MAAYGPLSIGWWKVNVAHLSGKPIFRVQLQRLAKPLRSTTNFVGTATLTSRLRLHMVVAAMAWQDLAVSFAIQRDRDDKQK
jgi:hypothetical protein